MTVAPAVAGGGFCLCGLADYFKKITYFVCTKRKATHGHGCRSNDDPPKTTQPPHVMKTTLARNEARRAKARSLRAKRKIIDATSASEIRSIIKARNKGEGFVGILPVAMEKIAEVFAGATWSWVVPGVTEGDSDSLASAMREVGENDKGTSLRFVFAKIEGLPLLRASY